MRSYLSDAGAVFAANIVSTLAGLATQSLLAWLLLPAGRGEYGACMLFVVFLTLFCTLGQEMANVYFVGSKQITPSQALTQSLLIGLAVSAIACSIGYILTLGSFQFLEKAPPSTYRIALLCIPPMVFNSYLNGIFLGMGAMSTYTYLVAAPTAAGAVGIGIVGFLRPEVNAIVPVHAICDMLATIAAVIVLRRRFGCRFGRLDWSCLKMSLSYGARFYLGKLFSMANVQVGNLMLLLSPVGRADIGLFSAASAMAGRLWLLPDTLHVAILPRSTSNPEGRSRFVAQVARLSFGCTAILLLVVLFMSKPLIAIILSPRFLPVLNPFRILLPGVLVRVVPKILTAYFAGIGRPGINSLAIAASVAANIALMLLFLPRWGLSGIALAMSLAYTLEAAILAVMFFRFTGIRPLDLVRPSKKDVELLRTTLARWLPFLR